MMKCILEHSGPGLRSFVAVRTFLFIIVGQSFVAVRIFLFFIVGHEQACVRWVVHCSLVVVVLVVSQ